VAGRRDSEDDGSETSAMSCTSDDKQRLAQTRAELREAGKETLRMAASHATPIGNIFDPGEGDDDGDEIETLREANTEIQNLKQRIQYFKSTVGAVAARLLIWNPHSLSIMTAHPPTITKASDILAIRKYLFEWLGY